MAPNLAEAVLQKSRIHVICMAFARQSLGSTLLKSDTFLLISLRSCDILFFIHFHAKSLGIVLFWR